MRRIILKAATCVNRIGMVSSILPRGCLSPGSDGTGVYQGAIKSLFITACPYAILAKVGTSSGVY
jgi:hypothetical protein